MLSLYQKPNSIAGSLARVARQARWNNIVSGVWAAIGYCNNMILGQAIKSTIAVDTAMIEAIKDSQPFVMGECHQQISLARSSGLTIPTPNRTKSFARMALDISDMTRPSENAKMIAPPLLVYLVFRQALILEALIVAALLSAYFLAVFIAIDARLLGMLILVLLIVFYAALVLDFAPLRPSRLVSRLVNIRHCCAPPSLITLVTSLFRTTIFMGALYSAIDAILHCNRLFYVPPSAFIIPPSAGGYK